MKARSLVGAGALIPLGLIAGFGFFDTSKTEAMPELEKKVAALDERTPGALGVYIRDLGEGRELNYGGERSWYLASTIKVPVAIAILQDVDAGKLSLNDTLTLEEGDKVDGPGDLAWKDAGTEVPVDDLLRDMLQVSDSTATGMLIRHLGADELNRRIGRDMTSGGFGEVTTILDVRRSLYRQFTPKADELDNAQILSLASTSLNEERTRAVARELGMQTDDFDVDSLEDAYARYYETGLNAAELDAYGEMLVRVVNGDLLKPDTAEQLFRYMKLGQYDAYRLEAGLDKAVPFAHKTGTQFERTCHVGIVDPLSKERAIVVAACVSGADEDDAAETLGEVGKLLNTLAAKSAPAQTSASRN